MKEHQTDFNNVLTFESNDHYDLIEITLPEFLYRNGQPRQTSYLKSDNLGIEYICDIETAIEIDSNILCVHLFSPYIIGWGLNQYIEDLELIEIDLHHKKSMIVKLNKLADVKNWESYKQKVSKRVLKR